MRTQLLLALTAAATLAGAAALHRLSPGRAAALRAERLACGVERWDVKALTDPAARRVDFPTASDNGAQTHAAQASRAVVLRRPPRGVERTTYRVHVRLIAALKEADADYHLVVADPGRG